MFKSSVQASRLAHATTSQRRYVGRVLLVSAVALAATVTACSSSASKGAASSTAAGSGSSSAANNAACPSATGVTAATIKLGVMSDQTGAIAATGAPFIPGAKAAIDQQNAKGGINGRKIEEVDADGASTENTELSAAKGLIESNSVFAIVNGSASALTMTYESTLATPIFSNFPTGPLYATAKNLFSIEGSYTTTVSQAAGAVLFAKSLGAQSVAVLSHNSQTGIGVSQSVVAKAVASGMKSAYTNFAIPLTSFDATSVAIAIKAANAEAVFMELALPAAVSIVKALQTQGYTPKFIHIPTGYAASGLTAGIVGTYGTSYFVPYIGDIGSLPQPAQDFRNALAKYAPNATTEQYTVGGYTAATLAMHAIQLAGNCPTQEGATTAMRAVKAYNPAGLIPQDLQFSPGDTPNGDPQRCFFYP